MKMDEQTKFKQKPANLGLVFLSFLIPLIGIVLGAVKISSGEKKREKFTYGQGL